MPEMPVRQYAKAITAVMDETKHLEIGISLSNLHDPRFFVFVMPYWMNGTKYYRIRGIRNDGTVVRSDCCGKAKVAVNWARSLMWRDSDAFNTAISAQ